MIVGGYIGLVIVVVTIIVTNPNNYRTKEEKEDLKNGKEV